jgi:hypothetical protein
MLRLISAYFNDLSSLTVSILFIQKLKDTIPEVKQATDRESRGESSHRGGPGRGRGRGGGFAARGFAAAGLTKGTVQGRKSAEEPSGGGALDGVNTGGDN